MMASIFEIITFKDILDIGIVAVLIYQLLLIVKGTRAMQITLGVVALSVLFWLGIVFKLYSLNWILAHFFDSFFIIVIILFQEEIRTALAHFWGGSGWFWNKKENIIDIEELVDACVRLGRDRIGALIVLERATGLNNFINTGTKLGSKIHSDLLYAIFQPKSPLHDGAVIVSKCEISSAGCFLPLSLHHDINRKMGSRHRAALGISEKTDALVVTVSEETGRIGLCFMGQYYVVKNSTHLRVKLQLGLSAKVSMGQLIQGLEA